ncbi:hypothetical protein B0T17DRAFT_512432 [Bombardia bombarda]|uniref:DUF7907 domain-containing protein n=1 Tax=Bombardia bombarda TaxID=252184 RepID=A0AA39TGM3_9PEZI|nr:hypothetical protein B0T17DRAFT_512432 [Bombardia bombarda]
MTHIITWLALASLSWATQLSPNDYYPPTSTADTFKLIANVTDLSQDLNPSIHHFLLTGVHAGAGSEIAVLTNDTGHVLWENGTDDAIGVASNSGGIVPYSVVLDPAAPNDPDSSYVNYMAINVGETQPGIGIRADDLSYAELYSPDSGTFIVCYEPNPVYDRPQYPVKFAKAAMVGGVAYQQIPDQCVAIKLLAQCGDEPLETPPPGANYDTKFARKVRCYADVDAIDWSQSNWSQSNWSQSN